MTRFGDAERYIVSLLPVGNRFKLDGDIFTIVLCGKPTCNYGEPKTDIYVCAKNNSGREIELKISFKKENADFLENKTTSERAEQLFGSDWMDVVIDSTLSIERSFLERPLIYAYSYRRTEAGSITLGWKFELVNKPGGDLSGRMALTPEQVMDVYAGINLSTDKKDAYVGGQQVRNSGVANCILATDRLLSTQDIINNLTSIEEYVEEYPYIYFACKALNYRTFVRKYDGDRPLAVYIDWFAKKSKLAFNYVFDAPLITRGNKVADSLLRAMQSLDIRTTDDVDAHNVEEPKIIYFG